MMLGVGMTLLLVTAALIAREAALMNDRAFLRTRPGGDHRAFWHASLALAGLSLAIAVMAAARSLHLNLGVGVAIQAALIAGVPVLLASAAVATGFTLAERAGAGALRVSALFVAPFAVTYVWTTESALWKSISISKSDILFHLTWAGILGVTGYGFAWWLAAGRRKWKVASALVFTVGAMLPIADHFGYLIKKRPPELPQADLTFTRIVPKSTSALESKLQQLARKRDTNSSTFYTPLLLAERLRIDGLSRSQYLLAKGPLPELLKDRRRPLVWPGSLTYEDHLWWDHYDSMLLTLGDPLPISSYRSLLLSLVERLPEPRRLVLDEREGAEAIGVDETRMSIAEVEGLTWHLNGLVMQTEEAGNFSVAEGGEHRLPSGGLVRVWPCERNGGYLSVRMRMVHPAVETLDPELEQPNIHAGYHGNFPKVLLHDPVTGRVKPIHLGNGFLPNPAYASSWQNCRIDLPVSGREQDETEEIALRSRLYLFTARPVARVSATVPPP